MSRSSVDPVLVVEDDPGHRELVMDELEDAGLQVQGAADAAAAQEILASIPVALVLSDLRLPGADGLALLAHCRRLPLPPAFIMLTAFGTIPQAVEALKLGADDFLTKPVDLDHLVIRVRRVLDNRRLQAEVLRYQALLQADDFHGMIGNSPPMQALYDQVRRLARASGPVLVTGESGTGKELVARAIHRESDRADGPFVAINCAGIPGELMESELFGHAAGAFSGARQARRGLFVEAHGGTLLLDEIGEMPLAMQAKLLRVLQDSRVRPVGGNREVDADVRVVAATHRDLGPMIQHQQFREDLFYRLETFCLRVPPLRERGEDIDRLAARLLARFSTAMDRDIRGISPEAMARLRQHDFPGNVRELANLMERAVTFCGGDTIEVHDLPERLDPPRIEPAPATAFTALWSDDDPIPTLAEVESRYIQWVLQRLQGNKRQAARLLGIGRRTLYRRLEGSSAQAGDGFDHREV
ncbi:DNA-binding transcriptional response regulator, NtrC family, contains REC, AAA-type ATPase, and a Fis-type DNA-binding domains [Ectothiorhodospira magna]|uniref:DNA-binding transcriptional response regulator, NtrC family, contains REC, AAA-type ATPase, and a Fis-type DNA-binding domains n=1 Tax=Ectothiorhodospira magna TaxID=867345 RepID=A0A1H9EWD4_9GAMM|nr:sigma-54 dependent transcriptional regulator [Ectothiorhodospira magna]SEQ29962.1 DNA-binding transcriptional response regulator, NtrC family, contains REC, AAA-type ATPase, and a Fis-type DNA-binding domains [Ectothiorhodospira magna]